MNFENKKRFPSCTQLNQKDIVDFLGRIGFHPAKIKGHNYWYHSPLRTERTPSFKVNRRLNRWYDFGTGDGSTLVDFGIRYFNCTIRELLQVLSGPELNIENVAQFHPVANHTEEPAISIEKISNLQSPSLFHYLQQRRISLNVAQKFCHEVDFKIGNKSYSAIGFKNNLGGYELRNKYFKGSSSPKTSTFIGESTAAEISVFEGFFDFLSWLTIISGNYACPANYLILNSTSLFEQNTAFLEKYKTIRLFLDNDPEGNRLTNLAIKRSLAYVDERNFFSTYKDLNDFICNVTLPIQINKIPAE